MIVTNEQYALSDIERIVFGDDCVHCEYEELCNEPLNVCFEQVRVDWRDGSSAVFTKERVEQLFASKRPLFEVAS